MFPTEGGILRLALSASIFLGFLRIFITLRASLFYGVDICFQKGRILSPEVVFQVSVATEI
jgi:hypothetical protein